jgi:hypothetical protein
LLFKAQCVIHPSPAFALDTIACMVLHTVCVYVLRKKFTINNISPLVFVMYMQLFFVRYGLNSYIFLSSSFIKMLMLITGSTSLECFQVRSVDRTAVCVKFIVLWNVTPYRLIVYQRLRQTYRLCTTYDCGKVCRSDWNFVPNLCCDYMSKQQFIVGQQNKVVQDNLIECVSGG